MKLWRILFLLVLTFFSARAGWIDVSPQQQSLLLESRVLYEKEGRSFDVIRALAFETPENDYINRSFDARTTVWVRLDLANASAVELERVLEISNPLLPEIVLYDGSGEQVAGILHKKEGYRHINSSFTLRFAPNEHRTLWLKVQNKTTMLAFGLLLKSRALFESQDFRQQTMTVFFLGILGTLGLFSLLLYAYMRDTSYLLYALYLVMLLFHQMTYIGFTPMYAPRWFNRIDDMIVVPKIALLIVSAAWYAMYFLRINRFVWLHRFYRGIIIWLLVTIPIVGTPWFYLPELPIVTGLLFVFFNTFAGIYIYMQGDKQARFFVAGWLVLIFAYILMIFDALGTIDMMHNLPNLLMWASSIEATLLLLAFVDRYSIVQEEKNLLRDEFLLEYNLRRNIIENEVEEKTAELSKTVTQKELLFKELHHRVKNNLQLILSLLRLQSDKYGCETEHHMLEQLERRIRAIARTHEILYQNDGVEMIDMALYVESYVNEMASVNERIIFENRVNVFLPLREAGYVGLIINELVSNAIKYAYDDAGGTVRIRLQEDSFGFFLEICDEGQGYSPEAVSSDSLGLDLVKTLVSEQLEGTIFYDNTEGSHYKIRFVL